MQYKIPFNKFSPSQLEEKYLVDSLHGGNIGGDSIYCGLCEEYLESYFSYGSKVLLTPSCTHALEMAALLLNFKDGDQFILPSYTFVSTALAFVMRGGRPVYADIRPDTLNIDEEKIVGLITDRTKAIVVVHYAGVACDMDKIMAIAEAHGLYVVEDNAHGLFGKYKNKPLGAIGHIATQSFHETKNISCGEGGALVINDKSLIERAYIIRDKGTNRKNFVDGKIDKYTWLDLGSSYVMSDLLASVLYAQLTRSSDIQEKRGSIWYKYYEMLSGWVNLEDIKYQYVPDYCLSAYHIFVLLMPNIASRDAFISHMKNSSIQVTKHYVPLHSSEMGSAYHNQNTSLQITNDISDRLVRLPLYSELSDEECNSVINRVLSFHV